VYVGTTVVLAVIEGATLTVANVGDSRAVLFRDGRAVRLSVDHKPDLPEEAQYIQSKGGFVKDGRVSGMLAVSRALGDGFLHEVAHPVPHIVRVELTEKDTRLILACDGVWDVMSDQEACELIAAEIDPLEAAKKLRDKAYELQSLDNISVIVVFLSEEVTDAPGD
jgi:serine/threonine protein phosphatase PrpC